MARLARLGRIHGAPKRIRSDNGPASVSKAVIKGLTGNKIDTAYSDPGMPWQNGADKSVNGKCRDECLTLEWFRFRFRAETRVVIETGRRSHT